MRKLIQTVSPWTRRELRMRGDDAMRTQRVFGAWVIIAAQALPLEASNER